MSTKSKKPRTFFKSREIAHQWAHQLVPFANSPGNMKFDGPAFYSYGTVIARILTGAKGQTRFLFNTHRFSSSTGKHMSAARNAVSAEQYQDAFRMEDYRRGTSFNPTARDLVRYYNAQSLDSFAEGEKALRSRASCYATSVADYDTAKSVDKFFGTTACKEFSWTHLRGIYEKIFLVLPEDLDAAERLEASIAKREASVITNRIARAEAFIANPTTTHLNSRDWWRLPKDVRERVQAAMPAYEQAREAQRCAFVLDLAVKYIADPVNNDTPADIMRLPEDVRTAVEAASARKHEATIAAWIAGNRVYLPRDIPVMLRAVCPLFATLEDCKMETTLGVTVPLADAERAFRFIDRIRRSGKPSWHRNGQTFAIGQFQLDAVNENGVVAGCHRVSWDEVDRFSASQGWTTSLMGFTSDHVITQ